MALKAEVPLLDYLKVSLKCKREQGKEKTIAESHRLIRSPREQGPAHVGPADREQAVSNPMAGAGREEPRGSWREEYLIAKGAEHGRPVCMVCGDVLSASGPAAAREHILQQHSHSLDFTLEEKRNILEAWSEEDEAGLPASPAAAVLSGQAVLDGGGGGGRERMPLCASSRESRPGGSPGRSKKPAEIEVLLDSEEQPAGRKRGHLKARCESRVRSQSQQRRLSSGSSKDMKIKQVNQSTGDSLEPPLRQRPVVLGRKRATTLMNIHGLFSTIKSDSRVSARSKVWPSEGGVPGSAPAEIRIFTDGSFPAGFALKLYCRTQPEPSRDSRSEPDAKKDRVDRDCSVSLLRLHSADSSRHLCPGRAATPSPLGNSAGGNVKDCRAPAGQGSKKDSLALGKSFHPSWRARFLVDYDADAGRLLCMVCESPLRHVCLSTVKRHILQCHAETLHLPREVRRAIREVWETRAQSSPQAGRK